ncbi:hypothetical protein ACQYWQ_15760 [Streptomyces sp. P6-2-1]|uniref:hypothetical protein n=1 Tax=Streptomyces sp. P6-2-1 TaxID=3422591 RepID=UPI003D36AEB8
MTLMRGAPLGAGRPLPGPDNPWPGQRTWHRFERYHAHEDTAPARECLPYRQAADWLTDEEFAPRVADLDEGTARYAHRVPDDRRVPRL